MSDYLAPSKTRIGHIHLKVSNLDKALDFYCGLLGFEIQQRYGDQVAFISAGGYHHHIGLNTWQSNGQPPGPKQFPGLFHTAILYPSKLELAKIYMRLKENDHPFTGFADHGVSEAIYLDDPDGNGVELYWDKPESEWPRNKQGELDMYTKALDLSALQAELHDS